MPSYDQRGKDKLWSVRFRDTLPDGTTQNKRLSGFQTKREAKQAYIDYMAEASKRPAKESKQSGMMFTELIDGYLEHQKSRLKPSSLYSIESKISTNIYPFFVGKRVEDITPLDILKWQQSVDHYSYRYKSGLRVQLSSIYRFGERYHNVNNIMPRVEGFRNLEPKKEMLYWTPQELSTFLSCIDDPLYAMYFRLLYTSGCRKGESLALTWEDIDFVGQKIIITKSITRKTTEASYLVTTPKNRSSVRDVLIPKSLCDDLAKYKSNNNITDDRQFIFGGDKPFSDKSVDRQLSAGCEASGVKKIRIHDFRHSCASLLIASGVSIVAVSKHLGHSNVEQTLNTYSHMMPSDESKMMDAFSGF